MRATVLRSVVAPAAIGAGPFLLYMFVDPPPYTAWHFGVFSVLLFLYPITGVVAGLLSRASRNLPLLFGSFLVAQTLATSFFICDSSGACGPAAGGLGLGSITVMILGLGPMAVTAFISRRSSDARAVGPDWTCGHCGRQIPAVWPQCSNCGAFRMPAGVARPTPAPPSNAGLVLDPTQLGRYRILEAVGPTFVTGQMVDLGRQGLSIVLSIAGRSYWMVPAGETTVSASESSLSLSRGGERVTLERVGGLPLDLAVDGLRTEDALPGV